MTLTLIRRLNAIGREIPEPRCPTCSQFEWTTGIVFLTRGTFDAETGDLSDAAELSRPEYCPSCGAHHPIHSVMDLGGMGWDII